MRLIITADIHLGEQGRLDDCIGALCAMRTYADEHDIHHVLVLGDLFHNRININIEVGNAAVDFFRETNENYDQEWFAFPGNHDMFMKNSWRTNSLKMLGDIITLIEQPGLIKIDNNRFWIIPFIHYENVYMKVLREIEEMYQPGDVLLTHIGTANAILNVCFLHKHWSVVNFADSKFDKIFSGHFHCYQEVGDNLWYPGSIIPFNFNEGFVDHGFLIYDTNDRTHEFVNILDIDDFRPLQFLTITDDDIDRYDVTNAKVRIHSDKHYTDDEFSKIRNGLLNRGAVSVSRMKLKDDEIILDDNIIEGVDLNDDFALLELYYDNDKPEDIDKSLLKSLNKKVVSTTNES